MSVYRLFWYISLVWLMVYLLREADLQRRINKYQIKKLIAYENKWFLLRCVTVMIFFMITWFTATSNLGSIVIIIGTILNNVLPKPSFDLIYEMKVKKRNSITLRLGKRKYYITNCCLIYNVELAVVCNYS